MVKKISNKSVTGTDSKSLPIILMSRLYPLLIISVLAVILYSNSFDCSFHFDDFGNIVNNTAIHDISDVKAIWNFVSRRFIGNYTFALNYHFHGLNPLGYHLVNLTVHLLAALAVYWMTLALFVTPELGTHRLRIRARSVSLVISLLFVSHPVQTQAVTYIVQRTTSLAALFYLLSIAM